MIQVPVETRSRCRGCDGSSLELVYSYGPMPLAGGFPLPNELDEERSYQLDLVVCASCGLAQVPQVVPPDVLFRDYRYRASVPLAQHFATYSETVPERLGLRPEGLIVEPGCNDGVLLRPLLERGFTYLLGIDPASNVTAHVPEGIAVRTAFFDFTEARAVLDEYGLAQLVIANNVFAHSDDPVDFACAAAALLEPDGVFAFEVHYLADLLNHHQYDTVYHEHLLYYSVSSLEPLLERAGLRLFDVERIANHGGSIRTFACPEESRRQATSALDALRAEERVLGLNAVPAFRDFARGVQQRVAGLHSLMEDASAEGQTIAAYGAAGRATILFNVCSAVASTVRYVVDESPERAGRVMPGTHNPIVGPERLRADPPDLLLISAWSYSEAIRRKVVDLLGRDKAPACYVPLPEPGRLPALT